MVVSFQRNKNTDGGVNSHRITNRNFTHVASTISGERQIKFWAKYAF
jgi:hypothetical protein